MSNRIVLALALFVAGCGGGDGDEARTSDWTADVTAICEGSSEEIRELSREVAAGAEDRRAAGAEVLERSLPLLEKQLAELRGVEVPDDLSDDYEAFLDGIAEALPLFEELTGHVRAGTRPDPELTTEFARIAADTRPFATEHGLTACLADAG